VKARIIFALLGLGAFAAAFVSFHLTTHPALVMPPSPLQSPVAKPIALPPIRPEPVQPPALPKPRPTVRPPVPEVDLTPTNRAEYLGQLRERFRTLAAGDPRLALAAAKELADEVDRETALFSLVTEWTHGQLRAPRLRAAAIDRYGLEAGLGMELANNKDLALLWADELTTGPGRAALLQQTALALLPSDPSAALALGQDLASADQARFYNGVMAGWAGQDTEAALRWAEQIPDQAERDAALQAIRSVAPVGIGAALALQDGYAVINDLIPGTPAETSGQLSKGDRIVAIAQGDNAFTDAHSLTLPQIVQLIRGAPGTLLQLQVLGADALPGSSPRTVTLLRDQIRFKHPPP